MNDKSPARQVLTGLVLLLATAGAFLAVILVWRTHTPVTEAPASTTSARQPVDLSVYLPDPTEYPPGFTTPPDNGIAMARLAIPMASPDQLAAAPCDPVRGMPAQRPSTGDGPPQLHLVNFTRTGGSVLSIAIAEAANWKDFSAIRTQLMQCPEHETSAIKCTDTAHQPTPDLPADDVIAVDSHCQSSTNYQYMTYYAIVRGYIVYILALGDDPRPAESVLGTVVNKVRSGATAR